MKKLSRTANSQVFQTKITNAEEFKDFNFFQMPKFLFQEIYKEQLSSNHRIIYMLLLNHFHLSIINGWIDCDGYVYLHFKEQDLADNAGVSSRTVQSCIKKLRDIGLIESVTRGAMKPNTIYLLKPDETSEVSAPESTSNTPEIDDIQNTTTENSDTQLLPGKVQNMHIATQNLHTDTQNFHIDTQKLPTSYTDINNRFNNTDYISDVIIYELGNEKLTAHDYQTLLDEFGEEAVNYQIDRILKKPYYNCLNVSTIRKWCTEVANTSAQSPVTHTNRHNNKPSNSFTNYSQRTYSHDALSAIEKALLSY